MAILESRGTFSFYHHPLDLTTRPVNSDMFIIFKVQRASFVKTE